MKHKITHFIGAIAVCLFIFSGCADSSADITETPSRTPVITPMENIVTEDNIMYIKVNEKILKVTLADNSSVDALLNKLKKSDIALNMHDYANMEKVGELDFTLPRNDEEINTTAGDVILYLGRSFVIYYDTNRWSLTRIGRIDNIEPNELKAILGDGDVTITLTLKAQNSELQNK